MAGSVERFLGGSPLGVILRLLLLSLIVGVVLSVLGIDPYDIIESFQNLIRSISEMGFEAVELAIRYVLVGAAIVVPIWFVLRLFAMGRRD